jgi:3-hydroxyisobutyrate dehydrogenase-like beta-hydroxyacid dehydrogenase
MAHETVAFLGLGHISQAMVKRLVADGFGLRVWDRTIQVCPSWSGTVPCLRYRAGCSYG